MFQTQQKQETIPEEHFACLKKPYLYRDDGLDPVSRHLQVYVSPVVTLDTSSREVTSHDIGKHGKSEFALTSLLLHRESTCFTRHISCREQYKSQLPIDGQPVYFIV